MNRAGKLAALMTAVMLTVPASVPAAALPEPLETISVEQEYYAGKVSVSKFSIGKIGDKVYTGKALKPAVTVKYGGKTLKKGRDYTVTYKNNKKIGTATIVIKGKGKYSGTRKITFRIVPAAPELMVDPTGERVYLNWSESAGASGYELQYAVNGGKFDRLTESSSTVFGSGALDTAKKTYKFRVRAYGKSGSKTIYSKWSNVAELDMRAPVQDPASDDTDLSSDIIPADTFRKYGVSSDPGTIKYLGFYDIRADRKGLESSMMFQGVCNGNIEYIATPYGDSFYAKLAMLIASDDSPDLVTSDILLYPGLLSKNMFESLDDSIDLKSDLWKDMKTAADSYSWNGKHYYVPYKYTTGMAMNYNKKTIADNNLPDPYELYLEGQWTWDTWRDMMEKFCARSDDHVGYYIPTTGVYSFINTTGTPLVGVSGGKVINNIKNSNVTRAMDFLDSLRISGLGYDFQYGDWVSPQIFAQQSDDLLFLVMEPEWTYTSATEEVQNKSGVENDVHDTVSDFAFVPMPRDPNADKYYQTLSSFGYLVPKGAKNKSGAVDFIKVSRVLQTNDGMQKKAKKDSVSPEPVYFTSGKNAGVRKWQITWGEQEYDLLQKMSSPKTFSPVNECVLGLDMNFGSEIDAAAYSVIFNGDSWDDLSAQLSDRIDEIILNI